MKEKLSIISFILAIFNLLCIPLFLIIMISGIRFIMELAMDFIFYYPILLIVGCILSSISFSKFRKEGEGRRWIVYTSLIISWLFLIAVIVFIIFLIVGIAGAYKSFF